MVTRTDVPQGSGLSSFTGRKSHRPVQLVRSVIIPVRKVLSRIDESAKRNYDHVAGLWEFEGWINASTAALARAHYGAYAVQRADGLRIITLNTDFWYQ